jgi:hypothetical protein
MSDEPEITVAELRESTMRLLDAAERRLGSTVELQSDAYWGLFAPDMFEEGSPEVLRRLLSDDVSSVRELVSRPEDAFEDDLMLWHDLNHLVGILQRVSSLTS